MDGWPGRGHRQAGTLQGSEFGRSLLRAGSSTSPTWEKLVMATSAVCGVRFQRRLRVLNGSGWLREEVVSNLEPFGDFDKSLDSGLGVYRCMNAIPSFRTGEKTRLESAFQIRKRVPACTFVGFRISDDLQ